MKTKKNPYRKPGERTISWGKYAGKSFMDVPTDYLIWFYKNGFKQMKNRKLWTQEELVRRGVIITSL